MPSIRARILNALLRRMVKPLWRPGLTIEQIRRHTARSEARLARHSKASVTEAVVLNGVPATWYGEPELAARNGTLLYLHGGAWCVHLPALYAAFAAKLSDATGLRVLLADYRLAPEHPFPAAVDDCFNVYRALLDSPAGRPLALAGDSAGGNLSLVTLMRLRDAQLPLPDCAVLLSPATDLVPGGPSMRYNAHADPMFSPGAVDLVPQIYCAGADRTKAAISPLHGDWSRLPPLYFLAGSTEMLLDDSVRAHDRALQAGTDSRIDVWPDLPHVFPLFEILPEARRAFAEIVAFIGHHIRHAAVPPLGVATRHEDPELPPADVVSAESSDRSAL